MKDPFAEILEKVEPKPKAPTERRFSLATAHKLSKRKKKLARLGSDALVYPSFKYLEDDVAPGLMFIPNKIMIFKLVMIAWLKNLDNPPPEQTQQDADGNNNEENNAS